MDGWLIALIVAGGGVVLVVVLQALGLVDLRDKRRRGSGMVCAMTGIDEVFFPTRAEALQERAREAVLPAPVPLPGDGDLGVYAGKVRIDLSARD